MAYDKVHPDGWHNEPVRDTPTDADAWNHIEQGITDAAATADDAAVAAAAAAAAAATKGAVKTVAAVVTS